MSSRQYKDRYHGRVGSGAAQCAHSDCNQSGEFRAPTQQGRRSGTNGPGDYQLLCLDHIREFNARYDWFTGMGPEEIAAAQSPSNLWANETRAFSPTAGVDSPPRWADFHDPLDTISTRFRANMDASVPPPRDDGHFLSGEDRRALKTLGLSENADRKALRSGYSALVRKYHPDKNGGNRAHEKALQDVIAAYTHLKNIPAFT